MNLATAYAAVTSDGVSVLGSGVEGRESPVLQFGYDEPIALPCHVRDLRAAKAGGEWLAIWKGQDDRAYLCERGERVVHDYGPAFGDQAVAVSEAGDVCIVRSATTYELNGALTPMPRSSQGMLDLVHGQPVFKDTQNGGQTIAGVRFAFHVTRGPWIVGQVAPDGIAAVKDGIAYTVPCVESHWFPNAALQADGSLVVAISQPAQFIPSSAFVPYAPPVRVPTFRPAGRAIGIGSFFAASGPTIAANDPRFPFSSRTPAWCATIGRDDLSAAQVLARAHGVPLGCYHDDYGLNPADVPEGERAWIYAYPTAGMSLADTYARVRADIDRCLAAGVPFDLVVATYCQYLNARDGYALTEQQALDALPVMWELAIVFGAGAVWCFAGERYDAGRLVDGYAYWPNLAEAVRRMQAASADPRVFPVRASQPAPRPSPVPPPRQQPTPEPTPMPTPNAPTPPKTIQARQLGSPYWKEGFMSSKAPQLLSRSMFKAQADGRVTVRISNPLVANYLGLPPKGTVLPGEQGDDVVLSIQPDGSIQARQGHANGGYEKATAQTMTGLLVWKPEGTAAFTLPFTE